MTLDAIKEAILSLSPEDQLALESWVWDRAIERDFAPGDRGEKWIAAVEAEIEAGKFTPIDSPPKE